MKSLFEHVKPDEYSVVKGQIQKVMSFRGDKTQLEIVSLINMAFMFRNLEDEFHIKKLVHVGKEPEFEPIAGLNFEICCRSGAENNETGNDDFVIEASAARDKGVVYIKIETSDGLFWVFEALPQESYGIIIISFE